MLCYRCYEELVVASFEHQSQYEYYGGNRSVSIEDIALEHFSVTYQVTPSSSFHRFKRNAIFHPFLLYNRKQYAATTAEHRKQTVELLKNRKINFWSKYNIGE